jgi:hypothetical protein
MMNDISTDTLRKLLNGLYEDMDLLYDGNWASPSSEWGKLSDTANRIRAELASRFEYNGRQYRP